MILFISESTLNFDFSDVKKQDKITKENLVRFFKSNSKKLKKMDYLIVDDDLITSDIEFIEIKKIIENKLILFSAHKEGLKKYSNNLYIYKNKDKSLHLQLEDIIHNVKQEPATIDEEIKQEVQQEPVIINEEVEQEVQQEPVTINEEFEQDFEQEPAKNISNEKKDLLEKFNNFNVNTTNNENETKPKNKILSIQEKIAFKKAKEQEKKKKNIKFNEKDIEKEKEFEKKEIKPVEKVIYEPEKERERKKKIEELLSNFKDDRYVKDEDIDRMIGFNYIPKSNRDDILIPKNKKNDNEVIIEKEDNEKEKKSLFKIPQISIPNIPKKEKINKQKGEQSTSNLFISNTSSEIAVFGGENGVGTTYCCIKLAKDILSTRKNVSVGYYQYSQKEKELSIINHSISQGKISDRFNVYENTPDGILKAYKENEIVIVDFGYLDKTDKELLMNITKIRGDKYMVVNDSFNKITSINNAISYSEYEDFKTIFNMYDSNQLINLQKEFKELNIIIFDFQII